MNDNNNNKAGFTEWLELKAFPILKKLNRVEFLHAVRSSVIWSIPMLLTGFLILFFLINTSGRIGERALRSFSATLGLLGIWMAFGLPYFNYYKKDKTKAAITGLISLALFVHLFPTLKWQPSQIVDFLMLLSRGGIIIAFTISGILISALNAGQKTFTGVKRYSVITFAVVLLIFIEIHAENVGKDPFNAVDLAIHPLLTGADTLAAAVVVVGLMSMLWLTGIHGAGVVGGAVLPFYLIAFNANVAAYSAGQPMPYIITPPFFIWCMIGGTGATLPLCVYMLFSKSEHLRKTAKVSILPALVNINEPLLFGAPLILEPAIAIPFVLTPVILAVINYAALYFNMVRRIFIFPAFAIPAPVYAYLCNLDVRVVFLILIDIAVAAVIYYPFFRLLEKEWVMKEKCP